jgi:hypothetical protein
LGRREDETHELFSLFFPLALQRPYKEGMDIMNYPPHFSFALSLGALQNASRGLGAMDPLYRLSKVQLSLKGQKIKFHFNPSYNRQEVVIT